MEEHRKERVCAYCNSCHKEQPIIHSEERESDVYVYIGSNGTVSHPFDENTIDCKSEYICEVCGDYITDDADAVHLYMLQVLAANEDNIEDIENSDRYIDALMDFCKLVDHASFVNKGSAFDKSHEGSIWFSGEGGTTIDGEYPIWQTPNSDYIIHPEFQKFMDKHDMFVEWYDAGTPFLYFK